MAPRERKKWKLRQESDVSTTVIANEEKRTQQLLMEMEAHLELDRILEARNVIDQIQKEGLLTSSCIDEKQRGEIDRVMEESNHIQELLHDLLTDDGWRKSKHSRDGITIHTRKLEGTPIYAIKSHTIFEDSPPRDFVRMSSFFAELDLTPLWFGEDIDMLHHFEILAEPTNNRKVWHMILGFPRFVPFADREVVGEGTGYHIQEHNAMLIFSKTIQSSPFCDVPPVKKGAVRIDCRIIFFVQLLPGNRIGFSCIQHLDLKLKFAPSFIVNYISQGAVPFEQTASMKEGLANYEGSEWEKRLQTRRDYYGEIEERVQEEVLLMHKVAAAAQEKTLKSLEVNPQGRATKSSIVKARNVVKGPRPEEGMPMWKAILSICFAVSCTRWSIESGIYLPWFVYVVFLSMAVTYLTRSVVIFRCRQPLA